MDNMDVFTIWFVTVLGISGTVSLMLLLTWCCCVSNAYLSEEKMDGKVVLVTGGDSRVAAELVRELCKRGVERVIVAATDVERGQDLAMDVRAECNGDVVVEYCDMASLKSVRDFCSKVLETESRIHVLINHACVQWHPYRQTAEGHEYHWGVNHLAHFVMTQLLMPLLLRAAPDARIVTLSSSFHKDGSINWDDPDYSILTTTTASSNSGTKGLVEAGQRRNASLRRRKYDAHEAFCQSKLANVLFTRELARRLNGTGVNSYSIDPGTISTGLGWHVVSGLGVCKAFAAAGCWLPRLKSAELSISTTLYCAIEPSLSEYSGLYYRACAPALTSEEGANLDDAYRLWEMSERAVRLTS